MRELGIDKIPEDTDLIKTSQPSSTTTAAERMNKLMHDLEQDGGLKADDHSRIEFDDSATTALKSNQDAQNLQSGHHENEIEGEEESRQGEDRGSLHEEKEDPHVSSIRAELEQKLKKLQGRNEEIERREKELRCKETLLDQREVAICERFRERELQMLKYEKKIDQFQKSMEARFKDMELSFQEKERHLEEHKKLLDADHAHRQSETDRLEKQLIEVQLDLRHRLKQCPPRLEDNIKVKTEQTASFHDPLTDIDKKIRELERQKESVLHNSQREEESESKPETRGSLDIKLNLTPFSGREPIPKNEASFDEFKMEFESVQHIYSDQVLKQALRKSLKDQAKMAMLHMDAQSSVNQIMKNLQETFGNVASEDSLMAKFLLAEQKNEETIVEWSLRLEGLILQIDRKSRMTSDERKTFLKKRFWRGLRSEDLKLATRVHFESEMTYEELINKIRAEEYELQLQKDRTSTKTKGGKVNTQTATEHTSSTTDNTLETIVKKIEDMDSKIEELRSTPRGRGYRRGYGRGYHRGSSSQRRGGYQERNPLPPENTDKRDSLNE